MLINCSMHVFQYLFILHQNPEGDWFFKVYDVVNVIRGREYMMKKAKFAMGRSLVLQGSPGFISDLITVKTGDRTNFSKTREELFSNLKSWMNNVNFNDFRREILDMAIVIYVDSMRYKTQDCDNIAKLVLDTLKKDKDSSDYLFEDDSQIIRLLVYKIKAEENEQFETNQMVISFRKHNPNKQMILENVNVIRSQNIGLTMLR